MFGALAALDPRMIEKLKKSQTWAEAGKIAGDSEFKLFLDTIKLLGIPHEIHWQPANKYANKGTHTRDRGEKLQRWLLALGHNITSGATNAVVIGTTWHVFFTGSPDVQPEYRDGCFLLVVTDWEAEKYTARPNCKVIATGD